MATLEKYIYETDKLTQKSSETELLIGDEGENCRALGEGHLGDVQPLQRTDGDPQLGEVLLSQQRVVVSFAPPRDHVFLRFEYTGWSN